MRQTSLGTGLFVIAVLACGGCQRVSVEKNVELEAGDILGAAIIDAPKGEQKIKVEFNSADTPINVYVILGKDEKKILDDLGRLPLKIDVQAKAEKSKEGSLEATIPAGKDYGVYLSGANKKTKVSLKIKSQ